MASTARTTASRTQRTARTEAASPKEQLSALLASQSEPAETPATAPRSRGKLTAQQRIDRRNAAIAAAAELTQRGIRFREISDGVWAVSEEDADKLDGLDELLQAAGYGTVQELKERAEQANQKKQTNGGKEKPPAATPTSYRAKRHQKSPDQFLDDAGMVAAIREHCKQHFNDGGWDVISEARRSAGRTSWPAHSRSSARS